MLFIDPNAPLALLLPPHTMDWPSHRLRGNNQIKWNGHRRRDFWHLTPINFNITVQHPRLQSFTKFFPILGRNLHHTPPSGTAPASPPSHDGRPRAHNPLRLAMETHQKHPCPSQYDSIYRVSKSCTVHHACGRAKHHRATEWPSTLQSAPWNSHTLDLTYRQQGQFQNTIQPSEYQATRGHHVPREWPHVRESCFSQSRLQYPVLFLPVPSDDCNARDQK